MLHVLQVGKPYVSGRERIAPGTNYNFRSGQHELLLLMDGLRQAEIDDVRRGEAEFAFVTHKRVIFFLYRFGQAFQWSDCPYSIWLVKEPERLAPADTGPETRALLQVILVDADHNLVQALRAVSLSPALTRSLHQAIRNQLSEPIPIREYEETIREAYARWPKTDNMLVAAMARSKGGE